MGKFKKWLYQRFLPAWCRDDLLTRNAQLTAMVEKQRREIDRMNAYIDGLHAALRSRQRVIIRNEVAR